MQERYLQIILEAFTFSQGSLGGVQKEIMNVDVEKLSSSKSIPNTIFKQLVHIYLSS